MEVYSGDLSESTRKRTDFIVSVEPLFICLPRERPRRNGCLSSLGQLVSFRESTRLPVPIHPFPLSRFLNNLYVDFNTSLYVLGRASTSLGYLALGFEDVMC